MRTTVLAAYLSHPDNFQKAYAFAWYHRMAALGTDRADGPFDSGHVYPHRVVQEVLQRIMGLANRSEWDSLSFVSLSAQMSGVKDLILVIKYLTLSGKLNAEIVEAVRVGMPDGTDLWSFMPREVRFPS
jgi:hypothetical protein